MSYHHFIESLLICNPTENLQYRGDNVSCHETIYALDLADTVVTCSSYSGIRWLKAQSYNHYQTAISKIDQVFSHTIDYSVANHICNL